MILFVLRRLVYAVPSLIGLLILTFAMIHFMPADPAVALAGGNATQEELQQIRQQYGLDLPIHQQFTTYVWRVLHLDFGTSIYSQRAVSIDLWERLPATLELTLAALVLSAAFGIPVGVIGAINHHRYPDFLVRILSVAGIGIASFWFALMVQLLFSLKLGWLPLSGRLTEGIVPPPRITGLYIFDALVTGHGAVLKDALAHIFLPAVTLAVGGVATVARFTRTGMLETLQKDFVTYERAAGYPRRRIVWLFALRPSLTLAVTQLGILFGGFLAGGVIVEAIFNWPGIGTYAIEAIYAADYKPLLGVTLLVGVAYTVVNVVVDVAQALIDPRVAEEN